MLTRERIQSLLETETDAECSCCEEAREVFSLAILAIDSERARRVGEAVIKEIGDSSFHIDWDRGTEGLLLRRVVEAIAAALRSEPREPAPIQTTRESVVKS